MPPAVSKKATVVAIDSFRTTLPDGSAVRAGAGDVFFADDPVVKARPGLFRPADEAAADLADAKAAKRSAKPKD